MTDLIRLDHDVLDIIDRLAETAHQGRFPDLPALGCLPEYVVEHLEYAHAVLSRLYSDFRECGAVEHAEPSWPCVLAADHLGPHQRYRGLDTWDRTDWDSELRSL